MSKNKDIATIGGEALSANVLGALCVESFLNENYRFRRNVLNGKLEFSSVQHDAEGKTSDEASLTFRPLTQEALNSIILRARREDVCEGHSPKADIELFVRSEEVPQFNPVQEFLENLPEWDGQNHVTQLFNRLPGMSSEQAAFLAVWLRSTVAHWLQMDTMHGNECVPVLIGAQGCGKTTFLRRLLPVSMRQYYLDHINLSNKFDKDMALTNNLLVNLDELEAIRPSQHANLKQTLSKNKVNGRPIYGAAQEDRPRFASFVATTNNPHPLTDATGSRRYICLTIPKGQLIDNSGEIPYEQLYAQVLYELRELKAPYWFNNSEVMRLQQLNQEYTSQTDMSQIVACCFRMPNEGEKARSMKCSEMLPIVQAQFPTIPKTHSMMIHLGRALKALGFENYSHEGITIYKVVPLHAA